MSEQTPDPIDYSGVAKESPEESVEHERESTELVDEGAEADTGGEVGGAV